MLNVIVVGAGIAGLSAAIALRRAGHCVHVYERSALNNEIGAAINVPPNAARFLLAWGLDPARWRFIPSRRVSYLDPFTLEPLGNIPARPSPRSIGGCELYYTHRVDLHNALKWMATREDGPGTPVTVHLKASVVGYDSSKPSIVLQGGQEIVGDVVIGADGVHSQASEAIVGRGNDPVQPIHYNSCYRFLIPASVLEEDAETRFWNEGADGWGRLFIDYSTRRRLVTYPCRNNTIYNFVGIFYDENMKTDDGENWQRSVDIAQVLNEFSDFNPKLLKIISPSDIEKRLEIYNQLRWKRATAIQILSMAGLEQSELVRDDLAGVLERDEVPMDLHALYKFTFAFNIVDASLSAMREYDPNFRLPSDFFERDVADVPGQ
ncbi:FAD binding domain-containing protein [Purpureocillium lavendulum]|uniref:FAD binding domain-containing protein n=1 Tax=Purpureocillium lavendulum TaxID=1247861 RepID=A0AB34FCY3_9HYPO|nr:FAD binding domain-containing protein [Purpureocillium lavendulum]